MNFEPIILNIAVIVLTAIAAAIGTFAVSAIGYIKVKTGDAIFSALKEAAKTFVATLQQDPAWSDLEGSEKKERAILWLLDFAEKAKLPLTEELASKLVEEAYLAIKNLSPVIIEASE